MAALFIVFNTLHSLGVALQGALKVARFIVPDFDRAIFGARCKHRKLRMETDARYGTSVACKCVPLGRTWNRVGGAGGLSHRRIVHLLSSSMIYRGNQLR